VVWDRLSGVVGLFEWVVVVGVRGRVVAEGEEQFYPSFLLSLGVSPPRFSPCHRDPGYLLVVVGCPWVWEPVRQFCGFC